MNRLAILITALCVLMAGCQKASDPDPAAGKAIFDEHCAVCHGPDGNVRLAERHDAKTPDLRTIAKRSAAGRVPRITLEKVIDGREVVQAHGSRSMPVWGDQFASEGGAPVKAKVNALLDYVESIQID